MPIRLAWKSDTDRMKSRYDSTLWSHRCRVQQIRMGLGSHQAPYSRPWSRNFLVILVCNFLLLELTAISDLMCEKSVLLFDITHTMLNSKWERESPSGLWKGGDVLAALLMLRNDTSCLSPLLWPLLVHGSLPDKIPSGTSKEDKVAVADAREPTTLEDQATADASRYLKLSGVLSISIVLCLATLCVAVDSPIISTAVSRITNDFHGIDDVGWYAWQALHPLFQGKTSGKHWQLHNQN